MENNYYKNRENKSNTSTSNYYNNYGNYGNYNYKNNYNSENNYSSGYSKGNGSKYQKTGYDDYNYSQAKYSGGNGNGNFNKNYSNYKNNYSDNYEEGYDYYYTEGSSNTANFTKTTQTNNYPKDNSYSFSNYSSNSHRKEKIGPSSQENVAKWENRYNRKNMTWKYIWEEEEQLLKEHLEHIQKKKAFDQEFLEKTILNTYFNGMEVKSDCTSKSFSELQLHNQLKKNLEQMGFEFMTPIQRAVIPYVMKGKDVMGCAQTGSGKTVAFLAPIINKMLEDGPPETNELNNSRVLGISAPIALILTPTRELAEQIYKEARKVLHKTGIIVVKVYGGVPIDAQIKHITRGCDILVATPGRLIDFMKRRVIKLNEVKYLVFDEADRMLEMGFEDQLREIIFASDIPGKEKRMNMMFSATFTSQVRSIARSFMNDFYFITSSLDDENNANENIKQELIYVDDKQKILKLHEILQSLKGSVIIFLETKRGVDYLTDFLNDRNYNTISIHGDKSQDRRLMAIECFSKGSVPILIATDVASRGLDFPNIPYVINFDLPNNIDDYIHRIGRTGRCGNKGTAYSFINDNCRITRDLYKLFIKSGQEIPDWFENLYKNFDSSAIPNSTNTFGYFGNNYSSDGKKQYRSSNSSYANKTNSSHSRSNYVTNLPADFFKKGENFKRPEIDYSGRDNRDKPNYGSSSNINNANRSHINVKNSVNTNMGPTKFQRGNY